MGVACFLGLFFLGGWHLHRSPPAADPSGPTRTCGRKAYKMGVSSRFVVNEVTWGPYKWPYFIAVITRLMGFITLLMGV